MAATIPTHGLGKVPVHGDFVRLSAGVPELAAVDRWLQEGLPLAMQALGRDFDTAFDAAAPRRVLTGAFVGIWRRSRDRVGRRFPLVLGHRMPAPVDAGSCAGLVRGFGAQADRLVALGAGVHADLTAFQRAVQQSAWCPNAGAPPADGAGLDGFWGSVLGAADSAARRALLLFETEEVVRAAAPGRFVVRLPAATDADVAVWMDLLATWRAGLPMPGFAAWGGGSLSLLWESLLPKYFEPMFWPTRENVNAYDLGHDRAVAVERQAKADARFAAVAGSGVTLADLRVACGA